MTAEDFDKINYRGHDLYLVRDEIRHALVERERYRVLLERAKGYVPTTLFMKIEAALEGKEG